MALIFPRLIPMVAKDQLQRVNEIGLRLFQSFAFRENIRQLLKGGSITAFRRHLVDGGKLEVQWLETHGKANIADARRLFQLKSRISSEQAGEISKP